MKKHLMAVKIVIIAIVCFSSGLLIGKYLGYIKLAREVQVKISQYKLQTEANRPYRGFLPMLRLLLDEEARLDQERDCLKKERDEAIRQRDIAVRTLDAVFRANQASESSKQTETRRTRPIPP